MNSNALFTGPFLAIPPGSRSHVVAAAVIAFLSPPLGAPCADDIVLLLSKAVSSVIEKLRHPNQLALNIQADLAGLCAALSQKNPQLTSAPSALKGKKSSNPVWYALGQRSLSKAGSEVAHLFIGFEVMLALQNHQVVPRAFGEQLSSMDGIDLTHDQIDAILLGLTPGELQAESWVARLLRNWIKVVGIFSDDTPPQPSLSTRIDGQLLGSALNAHPVHTAGVTTDRDISHEQLNQLINWQSRTADNPSLLNVLAQLCMRTSLSVDLLARLPVEDTQANPPKHWLDVAAGCLWIDFSICSFKAAKAMPGCYPAGHVAKIHLPDFITLNLQRRLQACPEAQTLSDLFPGEAIPTPIDTLFDTHCELPITWGRLRHSVGPHLLQRGFNALHAALLTLDLGLVCRSKLHYAMVTAQEWGEIEQQLYKLLQMDSTSIGQEQEGLGCQIVPTIETLQARDAALVKKVQNALPGKHAGTNKLVEFHNAYTRLIGWRLSVLMALRASQHVSVNASVSTDHSWTPMQDKMNSDDRGWQPVLLCPFALECIRLYKSHCAALAGRFEKLLSPQHPVTLWCRAVTSGINMRMLGLITPRLRLTALASSQFTTALDDLPTIAPDVGRKVLENHLRWQGLSSTDIDAVLRHSVAGQVRTCSTSHADMGSWQARALPALERVARVLFTTPVVGLAKD